MNQLSFNIACRGLQAPAMAHATLYQAVRESLKWSTSACGSLDNTLQVNWSQYMWVAHMAASIKDNIGFVGKYDSRYPLDGWLSISLMRLFALL